MKNLFLQEKGQSLIELMITVGLAAVILPALLTGFVTTRSGRAQGEQRQLAIALVREGQEATRIFREASWTDFEEFAKDNCDNSSPTKICHPEHDSLGKTWILASLSETVNGFTRSIMINDVYRDLATFAIVAQGTPNSYNDPSTKKVTTTVGWNTPIPNSHVDATEYLTRNENATFVDTTTNEFNQGTVPATIAVDASIGDGAVKLGPGPGGGDWCSPQSSIFATYDISGNGVPIAVTASTQINQDTVYASTGDNASGWVMTQLIVPHTTNPNIQNPYFNNENGVKAYGLFSDNNYIYFNEKASHNHTVQIAKASDLSNIGYFDPTSGSTKGISVYVATIGTKDTGFTTAGNKLYSFDLSTPQGNPPSSRFGSRPQLGEVVLADSGTGQRVVVVGTNAYVASSSTAKQLQIFNVSNPASMSLTKSITLGNGKGVDVFVDPEEKYAYVITDLANNNFFIVDLNNTNIIYTYSTLNGMEHPRGIIVPTASKRAVIVGFGGQTYQVFKIDDPSAVTWCGGISPANIYAVSGVTQEDTGKVFSYIVTDNSSAELQVIQGGSGGAGGQYALAGTFESRMFNVGHNGAFNYFSFNSLPGASPQPLGTNVDFKIAIKPVIGGVCTITASDFVPFIPGPISLPGIDYTNPGQCFKYQATLSGDGTNTPILYDVIINYSP